MSTFWKKIRINISSFHLCSLRFCVEETNISLFRLYHKSAADDDYHVVTTSVTSHMIEGLNPNTQYIVYVTAISEKGQSLPSETLIAWTDPAYPAFVEVRFIHFCHLHCFTFMASPLRRLMYWKKMCF